MWLGLRACILEVSGVRGEIISKDSVVPRISDSFILSCGIIWSYFFERVLGKCYKGWSEGEGLCEQMEAARPVRKLLGYLKSRFIDPLWFGLTYPSNLIVSHLSFAYYSRRTYLLLESDSSLLRSLYTSLEFSNLWLALAWILFICTSAHMSLPPFLAIFSNPFASMTFHYQIILFFFYFSIAFITVVLFLPLFHW